MRSVVIVLHFCCAIKIMKTNTKTDVQAKKWYCSYVNCFFFVILKRINKWSENFDEKPCRRGGFFTWGQCNITSISWEHCSRLQQSRYRGLNDPFCCIHRSRDSQCFSMGQITPKIVPSRRGISTPSNSRFLWPA